MGLPVVQVGRSVNNNTQRLLPLQRNCECAGCRRNELLPELSDVLCYVDSLNDTVAGHEIVGVSLRNPFVVRAPEPLDQVVGRTVGPFRRLVA